MVEKQENPLTNLNLAIRYYFGKGIEKDQTKAVEYFQKAAREGEYKDYFLRNPIRHIKPEWKQAEIQARTLLIILGIYYCHEYYGVINHEWNHSIQSYFEENSENNDSVGYLWLAYIYQIKLDEFVATDDTMDASLKKMRIDSEQSTIDNSLSMAASGFYSKEDGYDYSDPDIINFIFPNKVIEFLENKNISCAKVILGFYHQYKNDEKKSLFFFAEADKQNDIIASYKLGKYYKDLRNFDKAVKYFNKLDELEKKLLNTEYEYSQEKYNDRKFLLKLLLLAKEEKNDLINILDAENKALQLEETRLKAAYETEQKMLSYFTHTLRNALSIAPESLRQAIRLLGGEAYKDAKHYKAINKIASLFSTLSLTDCLIDTFKQSISDPQEFKQSWQEDQTGDATPKWVIAYSLRQSLGRIIFMSDTSDLEKLLNYSETDLIEATRKSFIEEVLPLNIDAQGITLFYQWVEQNIPSLDVSITNVDSLKFGANKTRFSLLFAIISELTLNALKYWDGENKIQISWQLIESENYVFCVKNHCKSNTSSNLAGTHKGLYFIKRLIELLGENVSFNCKIKEQFFIAELILNKTLFDDEL